MEEWRPVVVDGETWPYDVSNLGRVRRSRPARTGKATHVGRILRYRKDASGYNRLGLCNDGIRKEKRVHRLVLGAFVGPAPEGKEANHINGDKTDNREVNLEWVTRSENIIHAGRIGLRDKVLKLTEAQVLEIRIRGEDSLALLQSLAEDYGVSELTILDILLRRTWRWLT